MAHQNFPPGSGEWLTPWLLSSLQGLERSIGEVTGLVRSHHERIDSRIDDFREEMVGRLTRLEEKVHSSGAARPAGVPRLWEVARSLPWRHIVAVAALVVLGLMGHLTPAEVKRWLIGG
jgi:hypothetical protein